MPQSSSKQTVHCDPVLAAFELPLRRTLHPFGFPLALETNSADVMDAAAEGWGAFEQTFDAAPVRLSLGVTDTTGGPLPMQSVIRSRENLMSIIADPENFVLCDMAGSFAFGWVTRTTASDHPLLRYLFLASGAGVLLEQRAFAAMHGALVARNGEGVMLAGDSFAGKSTLAYACARSGWTYVSDDAAYLVRERDDRYAVGDPHNIRFRPDAPQLFPELADRLARIRPNGKMAIEVRTRELDLETAPGCTIAHVVYLNRERHGGHAVLRPMAKEEALENWSQCNTFGTEEVRTARLQCHERLLAAQLWEMGYSDLNDAIERLEQLVDFAC